MKRKIVFAAICSALACAACGCGGEEIPSAEIETTAVTKTEAPESSVFPTVNSSAQMLSLPKKNFNIAGASIRRVIGVNYSES
ncbi:MAG: hypothetical protein NC395_03060 [Prevotella sp.]|nr:hypothetical protein [Prevotella sp.]